MLAEIIEHIKQGSKVFAIRADEVVDVSNQEQLAVTVCYVDKHGK